MSQARLARSIATWVCLALVLAGPAPALAGPPSLLRLPPEQTTLRRPIAESLPPTILPDAPPPRTVLSPTDEPPTLVPIRLNDILRESIERTEVVRVLAGVSAVSSGRTIYDPAIVNTGIDTAQSEFDPVVGARQDWFQSELPVAELDPSSPTGVAFSGTQIERHQTSVQWARRNLLGGQSLASWRNIHTDPNASPSLFDPFDDRVWELSYIQPLLSGAGVTSNITPIVLARIDADRSYFQYKDAMQQLISSTITGYWNLMTAHVDRWAREQQVLRAEEAADLATAQSRVGIANAAVEAQARAALAGFRASLVAAEANLLDTDSALRNVLGLPPDRRTLLEPVTAPLKQRLAFDWEQILAVAEQQRPEIIELKLILAADRQLLRQADNLAQPSLDAVAIYRWNGLEGEIPAGPRVRSGPGDFTDWQLGVNFSVPLGLRGSRANLRQQELVIARDQANLDQAIHQMVHELALNVRRIDQLHAQYIAFRNARQASLLNLEQQWAEQRSARLNYLNFLQALEAWGNNVSAEAAALAQYNIALAELERSTGTILEVHGIRMIEERYGSLGPWGRHAPDRWYPESLRPTPPVDRYSNDEVTTEEFFELSAPEEFDANEYENTLPRLPLPDTR